MKKIIHPLTLKSLFGFCLVAVFLTAFKSNANANEALRPAISDLSKKVAKLLKGRGEEQIAIGAFTGPSFAVASSGPGISRMLADELKQHGVDVNRKAKLEIKGDYRSITERSTGLLELRIKSQILDRFGETLLELNSRIEDPNVLAQVLGLNKPDLGQGVSHAKASQTIHAIIEDPKVDVHGSVIKTVSSSPYAMEILTKQPSGEFHPQGISISDSLPFVDIKRGEVFAVRLINNSNHDAAVELTLDGLSAFAFTNGPKYRHFIVRKNASLIVKGWHRTNNTSDEFLITRYAESAAAEQLVSPDLIGTITAAFSAAWDSKGDPPADERSKFRSAFDDAVGRGKKVATPFREVNLTLGRTRDIISVRYKKP